MHIAMGKKRLEDYINLRSENLEMMDELKMKQLKIYNEIEQKDRNIQRGIDVRTNLLTKTTLSTELERFKKELVSMRSDQVIYEDMVYNQQREISQDEIHLATVEAKLKKLSDSSGQ